MLPPLLVAHNPIQPMSGHCYCLVPAINTLSNQFPRSSCLTNTSVPASTNWWMRMVISSDDECSQEEFRLDSGEFSPPIDSTQFRAFCESFGGDFSLDFPPSTSQPQHLEMEARQVSFKANFDSNTTCPASCIVGNHISPPVLLLFQISIPNPTSSHTVPPLIPIWRRSPDLLLGTLDHFGYYRTPINISCPD
jgi:hypothetical protein